ncbi:MAG: sugar phosphate nucleotidyltransferase [Turneriella sp.]|nr:sugar phosphate nucleotidyltransferase [Leptospiraceae bacterium]MCX7632348.1 sugar phosphate nucleotidyltransferase [Turneriella sp.]
MAGGSGTRLWPLSRAGHPKQLIALYGKKTLIEEAYERARFLTSPERILIGTNAKLAAAIEKLLHIGKEQYLVEPEPRNTAPIIAYCIAYLQRNGATDNTPIVVLTADHYIAPKEKWAEKVKMALTKAGERTWCLGIKPTRPDTGYGYIEAGMEIAPGMYAIASFREKPDFATANHYLTTGSHYWNSGMFIFSLGRMREDFRTLQPDMLRLAEQCVQSPAAFSRYFRRMPNISIDYAIMEKSRKIGVVPADFAWDDFGSFEALGRITPATDGNHVVAGRVIAHRAKNNIVRTARTVALLGVENCVVIDDGEVLLIAKREALPEIKELRERVPPELL